MSADRRIVDYLEHIREAADRAQGYIKGMTKSDFVGDVRTQQAVMHNLIIIGEASSKLLQTYPEFVARQPHLPWRSMRGMRNRVAHGYFDLDLDIIWDTVNTELPQLKILLPGMIAEEQSA